MKCRSLVVMMLLAAVVPTQAAAQRVEAAPSLRAGAARVDITPSEGDLPKNSRGILDRLDARAIVLDNGVSTAALITIEVTVDDPKGYTRPWTVCLNRQIIADTGIIDENRLENEKFMRVSAGRRRIMRSIRRSVLRIPDVGQRGVSTCE